MFMPAVRCKNTLHRAVSLLQHGFLTNSVVQVQPCAWCWVDVVCCTRRQQLCVFMRRLSNCNFKRQLPVHMLLRRLFDAMWCVKLRRPTMSPEAMPPEQTVTHACSSRPMMF